MGSVSPQGSVVGALACQRDSYLQKLESEVISCTELPPHNITSKGAKSKSKNPTALTKDLDLSSGRVWQIEFTDSVLFPEGDNINISHNISHS